MSKAILVLDEMPTCCRECPLYIGGMYGKGITKSFVTMCGANHSENFEDVTRYRLHNCPLKEAPEPKVDHA